VTVWQAAILGAWALLLVNVALTVRVVRWLQAGEERRRRADELEAASPLGVGQPAPPFRARTLEGASVGLQDYAGRTVAFVFVSPECGACRRELRGLVRLGRLARERAQVDLVLVSDFGASETSRWLTDIRERDGVTVDLPVLVAPPTHSDLFASYNPRVLTPYFCVVDPTGTVRSRDPLGAGDWLRLRAEWEGKSAERAIRSAAR
jgi:hypothetical protein